MLQAFTLEKCPCGDFRSNHIAALDRDAAGPGWTSHDPDFDDTAFLPASELGFNGIEPWGDVNREMGIIDDGGLGEISADSQVSLITFLCFAKY